ncbi:MAG: hypothetical protein KA715_00270 [Xanthomonadaceae bacterium]|nr:hypothetical protein [Xanthomonadaceae bacterium]
MSKLENKVSKILRERGRDLFRFCVALSKAALIIAYAWIFYQSGKYGVLDDNALFGIDLVTDQPTREIAVVKDGEEEKAKLIESNEKVKEKVQINQ